MGAEMIVVFRVPVVWPVKLPELPVELTTPEPLEFELLPLDC